MIRDGTMHLLRNHLRRETRNNLDRQKRLEKERRVFFYCRIVQFELPLTASPDDDPAAEK